MEQNKQNKLIDEPLHSCGTRYPYKSSSHWTHSNIRCDWITTTSLCHKL